MKQVRRLLQEVLSSSANTEQINHLGRDLDSRFDVAEVSGFGDKIVIPRKVAAECIVRYFSTEQQLLNFIAYMISRDGQGMSGGILNLRGVDQILTILREHNWIYDPVQVLFKKDQRLERTSNWGYLQSGREYLLTLASIDVVGSSQLVHTNVKMDVESTLTRLRIFIIRHVEAHNGRVWYWHGDGGIVSFYGDSSNARALLSMISLFYYLPLFNITENDLRADSDIRLRIGVHYGQVEYNDDVSSIVSESIHLVQNVEKKCTTPNSITITESVYNQIPSKMREVFREQECKIGIKTFFYGPA